MGGAGGTVYQTPDGPRTGAYLASRVARDVVERRMLELLDPEWNLARPGHGPRPARVSRTGPARAARRVEGSASGLRSKLLRALPTTMGVAALQRRIRWAKRWAAHLLWSG
jgi:glyoxylase-like metal-dependent hydrolase (beta-lactamase superfamily II)